MSSRKSTACVAFQGEFGANSDLAGRATFPERETLPCVTFEDVFAAVRSGKAAFGMIPIDNSIAGRVADIHHLLPKSGTHIIGEHFQPIEHQLLATRGASLRTVKEAHSHVHALAQCREFLRKHGIKPVVVEDTAGAARAVSALHDQKIAAIASPLAGKLYGLTVLAKKIEDRPHNITRFVIISKRLTIPKVGEGRVITSLFFRLRSVPAALYKAIGGFASTGVNLLKLESYLNGDFQTAEFYIEAEAHPAELRMQHALDELKFFSEEIRVLGVYPANRYRAREKA